MFYDIFFELCQKKGVKPSFAAEACGINRSNVSLWKSKGYTPRSDALNAIAEYFDVTTDYLLGKTKEKAPAEKQEPTEDDLKAAFFGGYSDDLPQEDIDALWEDAKDYARFKAAQLKRKGGKK